MKDAIQFHIEGLNREGLAIPEPSAKIKYVEISI
jgi:predicted RNase H-like HicB family nuclease